MTHEELYKKFCNGSPGHANRVTEYRPWGKTSIVVWLTNGMAYKVKYIDDSHFIMQMLTEEDIKKKYGEIHE